MPRTTIITSHHHTSSGVVKHRSGEWGVGWWKGRGEGRQNTREGRAGWSVCRSGVCCWCAMCCAFNVPKCHHTPLSGATQRKKHDAHKGGERQVAPPLQNPFLLSEWRVPECTMAVGTPCSVAYSDGKMGRGGRCWREIEGERERAGEWDGDDGLGSRGEGGKEEGRTGKRAGGERAGRERAGGEGGGQR